MSTMCCHVLRAHAASCFGVHAADVLYSSPSTLKYPTQMWTQHAHAQVLHGKHKPVCSRLRCALPVWPLISTVLKSPERVSAFVTLSN